MTKSFFAAVFAVAALAFAPTLRASQNSQAAPQSSTRTAKTSTKPVPQITVKNQPLVDSTIVVESFTLTQRGWLMSHLQGKDGKPGTMAGVTGPFAPGTYNHVRIKLWGKIQKGDKVWPMLHLDNGPKPGVFEGHDDHHVEVEGKTVTKQITITAVKGAKPKVGNYVVMPPCCMALDAQCTSQKKVSR